MTSNPSPQTVAALARIAECYKVPAFHGNIVTITTDPERVGRIVGADQMSLILQDLETGALVKAHPTWKTVYASGRDLAERILVERVTECMAQGLHAMGAHCDACGVTAPEQPEQFAPLRIEHTA